MNWEAFWTALCVLSPQLDRPPACLSASPPHTFHLKSNKFWLTLLQWPRCEPMSVQDLVSYPPTFSIWWYSGEAVLSPRSQNSRCCGAVSNSLCCAGTGSQHGEAAGSPARLLGDRNGEGVPTLGSLQLRTAPCMYPLILRNILKLRFLPPRIDTASPLQIYIVLKISVPASKKALCMSVTKTSRLMFRKTIALYSEKEDTPTNAFWRQNVELLNVIACGTNCYHCPVSSQTSLMYGTVPYFSALSREVLRKAQLSCICVVHIRWLQRK